MSESPLVSILMPSFKAARFLRSALDSIFSQAYPNIEVVVADGGSTDGTVDILREYEARYPGRLRWLSERDEGPADAVNKALALARGEIGAVMSADDWYYPDAIGVVVKFLVSHPECGLAYGDVAGVDDKDTVLYTRRMPEFSWESMFGVSCALPQGSVFFRMQLARETGGWNGRYYGCDLDYWLRLALRTQARRIPRTLSAWRRYEGQRTTPAAYRRIWNDYWSMIEDSPDLAAASPRIQRLSRASKHLLILRVDNDFPPWTVMRHMFTGLLLHPTFWRYNPWRMTVSAFLGGSAVRRVFRQIRGRRATPV
jgi:glycosyltransferase involved in cell wall biosynthesis